MVSNIVGIVIVGLVSFFMIRGQRKKKNQKHVSQYKQTKAERELETQVAIEREKAMKGFGQNTPL